MINEQKTKTVNYGEFLHEKARTEKLLAELTCVPDINDRIWIINVGDREEIQMGVNIASTGSIPPRTAIRFAECIKEAAELAKNFKYNGYTITYEDIEGEDENE